MADYSQTAATFQQSTGAILKNVIFGGTIVAGQPVYIDGADGKAKLARANSASTDDVAGLACCGGADGQAGRIVTKDDDLVLGATLVKGDVICLSPGAAGGLCEEGDAQITTGALKVVLGIATSTTNMKLDCINKLAVGSAL